MLSHHMLSKPYAIISYAVQKLFNKWFIESFSLILEQAIHKPKKMMNNFLSNYSFEYNGYKALIEYI